MPCATCDYSSPCACERRRAALPEVEPPKVSVMAPTALELARAKRMLRDAANVIASLLHQDGVSQAVADEAEAMLARIRAEIGE